MKNFFVAGLLLTSLQTFGQASVAYYPFREFISVSTNPSRLVWFDARVQTNTFFESLTTTLAPMINFVRRPNVSYYGGLGVQFNALNSLNNAKIVEGYSLQVGVRAVPFPSVPNVRVAFEIAPFSNRTGTSGILYSNLGIVYQFKRKTSAEQPAQ
ncbi:MAG: hypothetical protein H7Z72_19825 [Bacteroidetes bacterium]|nr:hypothetical protein [Fibrella sp.]